MKFKKSEIVFSKVIINLRSTKYRYVQVSFTFKIKIVSDLKESNKCPWSLSIENAILLEDIRKELGVTII